MKGRGLFIALFIIIAKSAKLAKVLKALKLLKFGTALVTFVTMALSAFVYAFWLGPWFSVGFVLMLFIHEMGHVMAMKMKGMSTSAPVFIPLFGAVIFSPPFKSRQDEAFIGYAGPLVGGAAAVILFGVWALLPQSSEILLLISYTAAFINLFNLLPIRPLDGGRTTRIIGEWFKYLGLAGLLLFTLHIKDPAILLIWILVIDDVKFKPWLKFGIGVTCQISMMILMFMGLSDQVWWKDMIYTILATVFNIGFFGRACEFGGETDDELSATKQVPISIRVKWFVLYCILVGAIIALMLFQMPYLPEAIKK